MEFKVLREQQSFQGKQSETSNIMFFSLPRRLTWIHLHMGMQYTQTYGTSCRWHVHL